MESESLARCWDGVSLKAALLSTAVISSQRIIQKQNSDFMSGSFRGEPFQNAANKMSVCKRRP